MFERENLPIKILDLDENGKNILDYFINREINLVINILFNPKSDNDLDYFIRRRAVEFGIPVITNIDLANTLARALININQKKEDCA